MTRSGTTFDDKYGGVFAAALSAPGFPCVHMDGQGGAPPALWLSHANPWKGREVCSPCPMALHVAMSKGGEVRSQPRGPRRHMERQGGPRTQPNLTTASK